MGFYPIGCEFESHREPHQAMAKIQIDGKVFEGREIIILEGEVRLYAAGVTKRKPQVKVLFSDHLAGIRDYAASITDKVRKF